MKLGVDIVNLSLVSSAKFVIPEYHEQKTLLRLSKRIELLFIILEKLTFYKLMLTILIANKYINFDTAIIHFITIFFERAICCIIVTIGN